MNIGDVFEPEKIAVVGLSCQEGEEGHEIFDNLLTGFNGGLYPVDCDTDEVEGIQVRDIEKSTDMAIISSSNSDVPEVLERCGEKDVEVAVVISSGFSDYGNEALASEVKYAASENQVQLVGPSSIGIVNSEQNLNATAFSELPQSGDVSVFTEDPGLGRQFINSVKNHEFGINNFASLGAKSGVDQTDLLEKWRDCGTKVIAGQIRGVDNGRKFMEEGRKASLEKPVILLKQPSPRDENEFQSKIYNSAFHQTGVIRVETMDELLKTSEAFSNQPLPSGKQVAVISSSKGLSSVISEEIDSSDLCLADLNKDTRDQLNENQSVKLDEEGFLTLPKNPGHEVITRILQDVIDDQSAESVVIAVAPSSDREAKKFARAVENVSKEHQKPVVAAFVGCQVNLSSTSNVSYFDSLRYCVKVLENMNAYSRFLDREEVFRDFSSSFGLDEDQVGSLDGFEEQEKFLKSYGISAPLTKVVDSPRGAVDAAAEVGFPVTMEIDSPDVMDPSEIGAVRSNVETRSEVKAGFKQIIDNIYNEKPEAEIKGVKIQEKVTGREVSIGVKTSPAFGPVVSISSKPGTEAAKGVSFGVPPISEEVAEDMIRKASIDLSNQETESKELKQVLIRLGKLSLDHHEHIQGLDIDRLMLSEESAYAYRASLDSSNTS